MDAIAPCFKKIYTAYYQRLVCFAKGIIDDQAEAEDTVAEVFMKYWHRCEDFATVQQVKAFLYISTKNACLNLLRQRQQIKKRQRGFALQLDGHAEPVLQEMVHRELLVEAKAAIQSLPDGCRRVLRLTFETGQSNRVIAQQLALSVHTVSNQKCRGIKILKERFAKSQTV